MRSFFSLSSWKCKHFDLKGTLFKALNDSTHFSDIISYNWSAKPSAFLFKFTLLIAFIVANNDQTNLKKRLQNKWLQSIAMIVEMLEKLNVENNSRNVYEATFIYPDYMLYLEHFKSVETVQRIKRGITSQNTVIHFVSFHHYIMLVKKITFQLFFSVCWCFHHIQWCLFFVSTQTQLLQTPSCL